VFTINYVNSQGQAASSNVTVDPQAGGYTGAQFVTALNSAITGAGISGVYAQIGTNGDLQLGGGNLLQASVTSSGDADPIVTDASTLENGTNYQTGTTANFTAFTGNETQAITVTTNGTNYTVNLAAANGGTIGAAVTAFNTALAGSGVYVANTAGTAISLEGASSFEVATGAHAGTGAGSVFQATAGAVTVTAPTPSATATGNALAAITSISNAVQALGLVQGAVGTGENKLNFAINLAQSQISSFSAAESSIKDVDVASAASNLSNEQILQQASVAALVQANAIPQAVLSLLKSGS
jgi:flagellin